MCYHGAESLLMEIVAGQPAGWVISQHGAAREVMLQPVDTLPGLEL